MERYTEYIDKMLKPTIKNGFVNQYKTLTNAIINSMMLQGDYFIIECSAMIGITRINIKMISESAFRRFEDLIFHYWDYFHFAKEHTTQGFSIHKDYKEGKIVVRITSADQYSKIEYRIEANIAFSQKLISVKGN